MTPSGVHSPSSHSLSTIPPREFQEEEGGRKGVEGKEDGGDKE